MAERKIRLSGREEAYLRQINALETLPGEDALERATEGYVLVIPSSMADQIGTLLTTRLATSGFDDTYGLTEEGRLIEDLIDRFAGL